MEATIDTNEVRVWKRYDEYREIDTAWVTTAPEHWEFKRLKWTIDGCQNGIWGDEPTGEEGEDLGCVRVADFDRDNLVVTGDIELTMRSIPISKREGRQLVRGDLLLEKSGGGDLQPVGALVLFDSDAEAVCSNFVAKVSVPDGYSSSFLRYLHAGLYAARVNKRSLKQSTGIQNLDSSQYFDEKMALPPHDEQQAIAAFLDRETARIDALIGHKERLIALLEEKRQAVISHAVEGKLTSPRVRLKFFTDILSGFAFKSEGFSLDADDIRLLRGVNVAPGKTDWGEEVRWPRDDAASFQEYHLANSDLVFAMDRPWISSGIRVARISESDLPCLLLQRVVRLRAINGLTQDYLELLLKCKQFEAYFEPILTGVSVPHFSPTQLLDFRFRLPNEAEQSRICENVRSFVTHQQRTQIRIEEGIERLQEYRTALISAAVTGQIDVREEVSA